MLLILFPSILLSLAPLLGSSSLKRDGGLAPDGSGLSRLDAVHHQGHRGLQGLPWMVLALRVCHVLRDLQEGGGASSPSLGDLSPKPTIICSHTLVEPDPHPVPQEGAGGEQGPLQLLRPAEPHLGTHEPLGLGWWEAPETGVLELEKPRTQYESPLMKRVS